MHDIFSIVVDGCFGPKHVPVHLNLVFRIRIDL